MAAEIRGDDPERGHPVGKPPEDRRAAGDAVEGDHGPAGAGTEFLHV